jgi:hypothetical protein
MAFSEVILTSIIAAIVAIITSLITSSVTSKNLKTEILSKHRQDLIRRQVIACETMWSALKLASKAKGENFVIQYKDEKTFVNIAAAKRLHNNLTESFNSKHGLYFSRELRDAIFNLRNFIEKEFLNTNFSSTTEAALSKSKTKSFFGRVASLRNALRTEIGVEDLTVGKEGPVQER